MIVALGFARQSCRAGEGAASAIIVATRPLGRAHFSGDPMNSGLCCQWSFVPLAAPSPSRHGACSKTSQLPRRATSPAEERGRGSWESGTAKTRRYRAGRGQQSGFSSGPSSVIFAINVNSRFVLRGPNCSAGRLCSDRSRRSRGDRSSSRPGRKPSLGRARQIFWLQRLCDTPRRDLDVRSASTDIGSITPVDES